MRIAHGTRTREGGGPDRTWHARARLTSDDPVGPAALRRSTFVFSSLLTGVAAVASVAAWWLWHRDGRGLPLGGAMRFAVGLEPLTIAVDPMGRRRARPDRRLRLDRCQPDHARPRCGHGRAGDPVHEQRPTAAEQSDVEAAVTTMHGT